MIKVQWDVETGNEIIRSTDFRRSSIPIQRSIGWRRSLFWPTAAREAASSSSMWTMYRRPKGASGDGQNAVQQHADVKMARQRRKADITRYVAIAVTCSTMREQLTQAKRNVEQHRSWTHEGHRPNSPKNQTKFYRSGYIISTPPNYSPEVNGDFARSVSCDGRDQVIAKCQREQVRQDARATMCTTTQGSA
jgi:hypothetical protein